MKNILLFSTLFILAACNFSNNEDKLQAAWSFNEFVKVDTANPILLPDTSFIFYCPVKQANVQWQSKNVLNPTAFVKDGKVYLLYRAQDSAMTSRLGLAISEDGIHFKKQPSPIFFPANDTVLKYEWKGGVEDPRIIAMPDSGYLLTYTSYDGKTARLCFGRSRWARCRRRR